VRLRVVAILEPFLPLTNPPVFKEQSIGRYLLHPTDPDKRGIQLTVP
jgi:hypothetical protein